MRGRKEEEEEEEQTDEKKENSGCVFMCAEGTKQKPKKEAAKTNVIFTDGATLCTRHEHAPPEPKRIIGTGLFLAEPSGRRGSRFLPQSPGHQRGRMQMLQTHCTHTHTVHTHLKNPPPRRSRPLGRLHKPQAKERLSLFFTLRR